MRPSWLRFWSLRGLEEAHLVAKEYGQRPCVVLGIDPSEDSYLAYCVDDAVRQAGAYRELRLKRKEAPVEPGSTAATTPGRAPSGHPAPAPDLTKGIEVTMAVNGPILNGALPFIPGAKKLTVVKKN